MLLEKDSAPTTPFLDIVVPLNFYKGFQSGFPQLLSDPLLTFRFSARGGAECDKTRNFRRVRVREFGARGLDDESESGNSYFMVSKTSPSPGAWNGWSRDRVRETRPETNENGTGFAIYRMQKFIHYLDFPF